MLIIRTNMLIGDHIPPFITSLRATGKSAPTIKSYHWDLNQIGFLAKMDPKDVQFDDLARFLAYYKVRRSPATLNRMKSSLGAFFSYLFDRGHIQKQPFQKFEHEKVVRPMVRTISDGERTAIFGEAWRRKDLWLLVHL